jgi:hypothetical protein
MRPHQFIPDPSKPGEMMCNQCSIWMSNPWAIFSCSGEPNEPGAPFIAGAAKALLETESRVDKAGRRKDLRCSFCRPNRNENSKRKPRADKHKTKRSK